MASLEGGPCTKFEAARPVGAIKTGRKGFGAAGSALLEGFVDFAATGDLKRGTSSAATMTLGPSAGL